MILWTHGITRNTLYHMKQRPNIIQMNYKNKQILITGGAGFIGSHIADALLEQQAHVHILDNLSTGTYKNLEHIKNKIEFIENDIRSFEACLSATKNIDVVFHCAAFVSVPKSIKKPQECLEVNVQGTQLLLEACIRNNVKSFVLSSSAAVYGERNDVCSEDNKLDPQSPYAESKAKGEKLCKTYSHSYNISTSSLRYFNVYGERQQLDSSYAAVVAAFTEKLKKNKPITIYGSGLQTRDFVHVSKVVQANLLCGMQHGMKGEVFNVASGNNMNLFELIGQLSNTISPQTITIKFQPARPGDVYYSEADCSKFVRWSSSIAHFPVQSKESGRSGETGRHARFRV